MGKSLASNKRGGKSKVVRLSDIMGRDFTCPYALNPYHDCSEICFKKVSENFQDEGKETVQDKGMKKVQRKGVTPTSLKALKSFNSCARNLFSINPAAYQGRAKGMWLISDRSDVHSNCKNASNPYHKCAEYCFDNVPMGTNLVKLNSLDGDNAFNIRERTSLQSQCIYASIPQHECVDICFENGQDSNRHEGENFIDVSTSTDKSSPLPNHINASIPCHHKVVECFFENIPEQKHPHKALNPKEEIKTLVAAESGVKLERKVAPSYHIDDEGCFQNPLEDHDLQAMMMEKEEKEVASIPQREVNLSRKITSDPYIEYCFKNVLEKDQPGLAFTKSKEENKIALTGDRWVNPECLFASNPYHACAEYCFETAPDSERPGHVKKHGSLKKIVSNKETTSVNLRCKFASNPYHECGRDCFQTKLDQNKAVGASMKLKKENKEVFLGERGVDTKCQFASNPYHVCAEYCIQNVPEREKHGRVMKLNNQPEITEVVSNKEITYVHPNSKFASNSYHQCDGHCFHNELDQNIGEEGKKEASHELRSDVNSMCKFTSNPFHKCSEHCSEGHQYKNQPVECIPVITEEEERNSLSEMRCHLIIEKSTVNRELLEASRPTYNNIESSIVTIFPDRIKKSRNDSKFVEALNPDTDYAEFSKGITMPDVQPLQLDASHLFLEWAKYCTQTPEYEIVMQAERRGFGIKNVQDNCKYYDSSILEKFKAEGRLQLSLPTSVLFFLGFLFALFKWTQMIQSVVMSSGRKKISGSVMHKKHVESK